MLAVSKEWTGPRRRRSFIAPAICPAACPASFRGLGSLLRYRTPDLPCRTSITHNGPAWGGGAFVFIPSDNATRNRLPVPAEVRSHVGAQKSGMTNPQRQRCRTATFDLSQDFGRSEGAFFQIGGKYE